MKSSSLRGRIICGQDFDHIKLVKGETKEYIQAITGVNHFEPRGH